MFAGIFFVLPCIESYQKVDLRTITLGVPPQEVREKHPLWRHQGYINFPFSLSRSWQRTLWQFQSMQSYTTGKKITFHKFHDTQMLNFAEYRTRRCLWPTWRTRTTPRGFWPRPRSETSWVQRICMKSSATGRASRAPCRWARISCWNCFLNF